jgi:hypothetical protein
MPVAQRKMLRGASIASYAAAAAAFVDAAAAHPWMIATALGVSLATPSVRRLLHWRFKRRFEKVRRGEMRFEQLSNAQDGELCLVRGRVQAQHMVEGVAQAQRGVFRRTHIIVGHLPLVDEQAEDFSLIDHDGERITVDVSEARFDEPDPPFRMREDYNRFAALPLPRGALNLLSFLETAPQRGRPPIYLFAAESMLEAGEEIDVIGYKSRVVDPTVVDRLARETPMRTILRGGQDLPVILSRVRR